MLGFNYKNKQLQRNLEEELKLTKMTSDHQHNRLTIRIIPYAITGNFLGGHILISKAQILLHATIFHLHSQHVKTFHLQQNSPFCQ